MSVDVELGILRELLINYAYDEFMVAHHQLHAMPLINFPCWYGPYETWNAYILERAARVKTFNETHDHLISARKL